MEFLFSANFQLTKIHILSLKLPGVPWVGENATKKSKYYSI